MATGRAPGRMARYTIRYPWSRGNAAVSTSANAPGDPGRDRGDDAVEPESRDTGSQAGTSGSGGAEGRDLSKKMRDEARRSEAAARKSARGQGKRPDRKSGSKAAAATGREGEKKSIFARIAMFVR